MFSYLKCIVYDKLLKPRQSFSITLYITLDIWVKLEESYYTDFLWRRICINVRVFEYSYKPYFSIMCGKFWSNWNIIDFSRMVLLLGMSKWVSWKYVEKQERVKKLPKPYEKHEVRDITLFDNSYHNLTHNVSCDCNQRNGRRYSYWPKVGFPAI